MKLFRPAAAAAVLILLSAAVSPASAEDGAPAPEELRAKVETAFSNWMDNLPPAEWRIRTSEEMPYGTRTAYTAAEKETLFFAGQTKMLKEPDSSSVSLRPDSPQTVRAVNPRYGFTVMKEKPDEEWDVVKVQQNQGESGPLSVWQDGLDPVKRSASAPFRELVCPFCLTGCYTVLDILRYPGLVPESVREEPDGGISFSFHLDPIDESTAAYIPIQSGTITLTAGYLIKDARLTIPEGNLFALENEYSEDANPPLVRHTETSFNGETPVRKRIVSIETGKLPRLALKRFTLSGYGLPEPDYGYPSAGGARTVLVALGVVLILIAVSGIFRKRRAKMEEETP